MTLGPNKGNPLRSAAVKFNVHAPFIGLQANQSRPFECEKCECDERFPKCPSAAAIAAPRRLARQRKEIINCVFWGVRQVRSPAVVFQMATGLIDIPRDRGQ